MCTNLTSSLLASRSDLDLECEVTKVFKVFGTVYVKVRRDQNTMPFAFCQFTVSTPSSFESLIVMTVV